MKNIEIIICGVEINPSNFETAKTFEVRGRERVDSKDDADVSITLRFPDDEKSCGQMQFSAFFSNEIPDNHDDDED
ncbi:hypothetical protein COT94_02070 [Candidatus Falkowbacteria bacterium CG10_big_fil_rev_8_21_14_0_10_37_14]|uniref:Uncharacterized protein n=1 Tax=Candidatus Falkowbacteria bacterium CG10_big_fil_rev_8_21_14_0_10_37_14 TaxID=1974561 RepID=A0A2M6WTB1_9BACT|nr:hypothetical protein [Candidatus Falkowbacteria bacterium]PIT96030.1 MAG: hypothetical protein COT94_02070 [Candidatus Falkowbacteria bacterium CG10_big_fil_rev_8_21_14_0_10_37_14]